MLNQSDGQAVFVEKLGPCWTGGLGQAWAWGLLGGPQQGTRVQGSVGPRQSVEASPPKDTPSHKNTTPS